MGNLLSVYCKTNCLHCLEFRVSESVVIPANSKMTVPGYICRRDNEVLPRLAIVESTEGVGDKGLLLARSVAAPSSQMIPLRMLNLDENTKKLYKSTVVGTYDPVLEVLDSVSSNHETSAARVGKVEHSDNNSSDPPGHLKVILEGCGKNLCISASCCCRKFVEEV